MELFKLLGTIAIENGKANSAIDETTGKAEKSESKISSAFKKIGSAVVTYFAVDKIVDFGKECISMGSDVEEMENKFNVVFQGMTDEVDAWADEYATAIGRNKNVIKTYLADNQNMFVGMGMTREAGAKLSEQMVQLGLDLASFNNLQEDDAVNALSKALMGESEAAKTLGAVLNENTIAMAMNEMGINGKFDALTEAEKMEVRYQAIVMQSTDAIGDCERSLDSYKGTQIQLQSALENTKEKIGALLLPLATLGNKIMTEGVNKIQSFIDVMSDTESRANFFKTTLESMFSSDFIASMEGWYYYLKDVIQLFASNTVETFSGKIYRIQQMFIELGEAIRPIVETYINGLVTQFDTLLVIWNDVLVPIISVIINVFTDLARTIITAITPAIQQISEKFQELQSFVSAAIQNYILPAITAFIDMIRDLWFENQDKITAIGELFSTVFQAIANLVSWFVDIFKSYIYPFLGWLFGIVQSNMENIKAVFQSAFDIIGGIVQFFIALFKGDWQGMWDAVKSILQAGYDFVVNIFNLLFSVASSIVSSLFEAIQNAFENIKNAILDKISAALNFVIEKFNSLPEPIKNVLSVVLGFIVLCVQSIIEKIKTTYENVVSIFNTIKDFITTVMNAIWSAISNKLETIKVTFSTKLSSVVDGVKEKFQSILDGIKEKMELAKNAVSEAIEKIKGFFDFEWHLPELKLPHIKIDGEWDLAEGKVPSFGVEWYANGAVLNKPTIFGMNGNNAMVGGESGAEAVAPIDVLQGYVAEAVANQNKELVSVLYMILKAICNLDDGLANKLYNVMLGMRFDIDNREFARLVKAVN